MDEYNGKVSYGKTWKLVANKLHRGETNVFFASILCRWLGIARGCN